MTKYAWIIDRDHLFDGPDHPSDIPSDAGKAGPADGPDELFARLAAGEGLAFRMLDDDGELYYSGRILFKEAVTVTTRDGAPHFRGRIVTADSLSGDEAADFGPLLDYGSPNAGATDLQYRDAEGRWGSL